MTGPSPALGACLLLLGWGCGVPAPETPAPVVQETGSPPADTAPPQDTAPEEEDEPPEEVGGPGWQPELQVDEIGAYEVDDSWVFDLDTLHQVDITLSVASWDALVADPYTYALADVEVDGVALEDVGMRLRGKFGSFRAITGKPKIKLDFGEFVDDQTLHGLSQLSMNNSVVDCGYLKDPIAMEAFGAVGLPAPRTAMTQVTINGENYGLYVLIEPENKVFLERVFEDGSGNLYDGKYFYDTATSAYVLLDFNEGKDAMFQLEEGVSNGFKDISEISGTIREFAGTPDYYAEMGEVIDWESFHKEQLVEQFVGQNDGYGLNSNNYRVYFDPDDDRAHFIPWDMDYAFLQDSAWGRSWTYPTGQIAYYCMTDTTCKAAQQGYVEEVLDALSDADLTARFAALAALTEAEARSDPKRECAVYYVDSYRSTIESWLVSRHGYMRSWWGL